MPVAASRAAPPRGRPDSQEPPPWLDAPDESAMADMADMAEVADDPAVRAEPAAASTPPPPPASGATIVRTPLGDRWTEVVEQMVQQGVITALVRELAMQSQCVAIEQDGGAVVWRLRTERETLRAAAHRDKLQAALAQSLNQPVRLDIEAGAVQDSPALRATEERERRQREAEQIIHNDPLVQALMAQYKTARIVPGSIRPH